MSIIYLFLQVWYKYENVSACSQVCGYTIGVSSHHVCVHVGARG